MFLLSRRIKLAKDLVPRLILFVCFTLFSNLSNAEQIASQVALDQVTPVCKPTLIPTFEVAFSPNQGARALIITTINNAKKTLYVAAFSFTSTAIADALENASKRGVDVKVVFDKKRINEQGCVYEYLKNKKLDVRANDQYKIMHNKFMIIDNDTLQLGSYNYTKAAEKSNAENVLVIHNSQSLADKYLVEWQKLWNEAG